MEVHLCLVLNFFADLFCFVTNLIFSNANNCKYNGFPCKYKGMESKTCNNFFLPAVNKDLCDLCGQSCSLTVWCDHFDSWSADEWACVQAYTDDLQHSCERKERKSKSFSSSFFCFDPDGRPVPVSEYVANMTCWKVDKDAQDVTETISPSTKTLL